MKTLATVATLLAFAGAASATQLFNNGGIVTHPGAGAGGADVSMASATAPYNAAGSNARLSGAGPNFRIADDFTVGGPGWFVDTVRVHAYQTNSTTTSPFNAANLNVWNGNPSDPASLIVATSTNFTSDWTGVYRIFNGVANLGNTARPVMYLDFAFPSVALLPGTFWIDWQVGGGTELSGWAPYVMQVNPSDPNAPITVTGNGQQMTTGGVWQDLIGTPPAETPFSVSGQVIPAPGALALIGLGGLVATRRRRA